MVGMLKLLKQCLNYVYVSTAMYTLSASNYTVLSVILFNISVKVHF